MSNLIKMEKRYEELLEKLLEEQKKLEKINQKIEKQEIIERINIKEETELVKRMETEILDETKALAEIETKLRKVKIAIFKKRFWNEIDEHRKDKKTKTKPEKLRKINKKNEKVIERQEIRIASIKDPTKRETNELRIERIN